MKEENWWWIDYMEGELDPTTHPDIEFLLEKSPADREEFESWRTLKSWVREVDPIKEAQWSESDLSNLKEKILKAADLEGSAQGLEIQIRPL